MAPQPPELSTKIMGTYPLSLATVTAPIRSYWTSLHEIPTPVSYTHLDVYKRQPYNSSPDLHLNYYNYYS